MTFSIPSSYATSTDLSGSALYGTTLPPSLTTTDFSVPFEGGPTAPAGFSAGEVFGASSEWTFITTPDDISWGMGAEVSPLKIFGTNQVPVVVGSKGMRELSLGNALVEGFSRRVQVEDKVAALEALMNFSLVSGEGGGYVKVPVFQVTANDKVYGAGQGGIDGGYFVIKDIKVKETIRDLTGMSTRAYVDVSFIQVPPYQVSSGVDQASKEVSGAKATALQGNAAPKTSTAAATITGSQGVGTTQPASGANAPSPSPPPSR